MIIWLSNVIILKNILIYNSSNAMSMSPWELLSVHIIHRYKSETSTQRCNADPTNFNQHFLNIFLNIYPMVA